MSSAPVSAEAVRAMHEQMEAESKRKYEEKMDKLLIPVRKTMTDMLTWNVHETAKNVRYGYSVGTVEAPISYCEKVVEEFRNQLEEKFPGFGFRVSRGQKRRSTHDWSGSEYVSTCLIEMHMK